MIRFLTAGETHGKGLTVIIDGIPANLEISKEEIDKELALRQQGYGRGARMKIENDKVEILSGVRHGKTLGSPISLFIKNKDWANWQDIMSSSNCIRQAVKKETKPRPGHADLTGILKYGFDDIRNVLERASARETAARVAAGAVFKKMLNILGIDIFSYVNQVGLISVDAADISNKKIKELASKSLVRTINRQAELMMIQEIKQAGLNGDTIGGQFKVIVSNVPVGLGSYVQWDQKLDAKIAQSLMSVQAVKAVEFGIGVKFAERLGSLSHDQIYFDNKNKKYLRKTNNAGGFEGGMTNGEDIVAVCTMKAIPSLTKPLNSVDIKTKKACLASAVRSDVCAISAAGIVGEAAVSYELANAITLKFGGDNINDIKKAILKN